MTEMMPAVQRLSLERAQELAANPERARLLADLMSASTLVELEVAGRAQVAWLRANPDDAGVLGAGEDLANAFESLCLRLFLAMGFTPAPDAEHDANVLWVDRRRIPGQTIAFESVWANSPVGVDSVQLAVVMVRQVRASKGWLVTNEEFTASARDYASAHSIELLPGGSLKTLLGHHVPDLLSRSVSERQPRVTHLPRRVLN